MAYSNSHFGKECADCPMAPNCISPTSIGMPERMYLMKLMGLKRAPPTEAMLKGRDDHEAYLKDYPTLADIGEKEFKNKIKLKQSIELQEVGICSPNYGLRGYVDKFDITFDGERINVTPIELKSGFSPKYVLQVFTYGIILSDINAKVFLQDKDGKNHAFDLYPDGNFKLNIKLILQQFKKKPQEYYFMKDDIISAKWAGHISTILSKVKTLRKYHILRFDLEETDKCFRCFGDTCSYWEHCKELNDHPHKGN